MPLRKGEVAAAAEDTDAPVGSKMIPLDKRSEDNRREGVEEGGAPVGGGEDRRSPPPAAEGEERWGAEGKWMAGAESMSLVPSC